jgi:hypothetical protein
VNFTSHLKIPHCRPSPYHWTVNHLLWLKSHQQCSFSYWEKSPAPGDDRTSLQSYHHMSNYSPSSTGDRLYCGALLRPKMLVAWSKQCKAGLNRASPCLIWKNKNGCRSLLACELIVGRDHCTAQRPSPHRRRCACCGVHTSAPLFPIQFFPLSL